METVEITEISRTPRGEQTAERILDAAEALFAEHGYAGTTLRDVAERVGIRIPSLYNHFAGKDALYTAVLERGIGPIVDLLAEFAESGPAIYRDTRGAVQRIVALLAQRPNSARLVLYETLAGGERLTPILRRWLAPALTRARELVERSPEARRWAPDKIPLLVLALYHIAIGYFAIAPLAHDLGLEELTSAPALERQTEFMTEVVERLLVDKEPSA